MDPQNFVTNLQISLEEEKVLFCKDICVLVPRVEI